MLNNAVHTRLVVKNALRSLLIVACLVPLSTTSFAASDSQHTINAIMKDVDDYASQIRALTAGSGKISVEDTYRKGQTAAHRLVRILASLSEEDYRSVETRMMGYHINRNEVVFVEPDAAFFQRISRHRGTAADSAFFGFLGELRPRNGWPAYREWQTDSSGCTSFGRGVLTGLYRKAVEHIKTYGSAYLVDMNAALKDITVELTESTCACGDRESTIRELTSFLEAFPEDAPAPLVRKRLSEIKSGKTTIRFKCTSG